MRGSQRNAVRIFVSAAAGHRAARAPSPLACCSLPSSTADQSDQVSGAKTLALRELAQSASRANQRAWAEKRKNAFEHAELPGACHKRTNCVEIV